MDHRAAPDKNPAPSAARKHYSYRHDLLVIVLAAMALFVLASRLDTEFLHDIVHGEFAALLPTLIGLNFVLAALLIRRWRALNDVEDHNHETALRLERERILLRTVIDQLPDYIFVKDTEGRFILSNIAHAAAVKATPEALIGKTANDFFPPELAARYQADDEAIIRSEKPLINLERPSIDPSGEARLMMTTKVPLIGSDGRVAGLVGISRDITHRKRQEEQALELARERERVRMMTIFTKEAAHDFRTPLATISASLYLLSRSEEPERRAEHAHRIEDAVSRLSRLLDGWTTMTLLDSLTALDVKDTNVNHLIETVIAAAPSVTRHPQVQVTLDLDQPIPAICGDAAELGHAFRKLLDNALHYTPDGGSVTITTRHSGGEVVVEVRDTGIGIHADDLPHIFDRFYRTDRARSSETGGIGLGLSIARKIIELHQGRIDVESAPGKGSTFRVYLPASGAPVLGEPCAIVTAA